MQTLLQYIITGWLLFSALQLPAQSLLTVNQRVDAFFEAYYDRSVAMSPEWQTYEGIRDQDDGKWDDYSIAMDYRWLAHDVDSLQDFETRFGDLELEGQTALSARLFRRQLHQTIDSHRWRHYRYWVNPTFGIQNHFPTFLINAHSIASLEQAHAYISRLRAMDEALLQVVERMELARREGILSPQLAFTSGIADIDNQLAGAPFDDSPTDSALMADFRHKIASLQLEQAQEAALLEVCRQALLNHVQPGYRALQDWLRAHQDEAPANHGLWRLPHGDEYYAHRLRVQTTTDLSAEEIHQLGLDAVERIHKDMRSLMQRVGFEGALQDFFHYVLTDEQFYLPNTDDGRQQFFNLTEDLIEGMEARLPEMFNTFPQAELELLRVEPFREQSAPAAFYMSPAPDGSRPGRYYINLYDMRNQPLYRIEALTYHEAIPGHHMQIAIAQEIEGLPRFRTRDGFTAYAEGWGLYCELLPKEFGFYTDPWQEFGRLSMELWRATRLVLDTGLHAKSWSREKAIQYMMDNSPSTYEVARASIDRYLVLPAQATTYRIGLLKMLELRQRAMDSLGDRFDIRAFHDVILLSGSVPLDILEELVDAYIADKHD